MTIYTRSALQNKTLPRGWKQIKARPVNTTVETIFYISPEGKRFQSLEAAKGWLMANIEEFNDSEIIESPKKFSRRMHEEKAEAELEYVLNHCRVELPENIKRRRKIMSSKSPFSNLLKVTLTRNYKLNIRRAERERRKSLFGWLRRDPRKKVFRQKMPQSLTRPRMTTRREA